MEEKSDSTRRERRKKSEGRASENQQISNDEGRSASKGRERPTRSEEPIRREVITEQRGSDDRSSSSGVRSSRESSGSRSNRSDEQSNSNQIRPSSSQRVSREDVSVRPSSSQRRNDSLGESKERVVRDTVSFSRSEQPTSRQAPSPIPSQPTYNSKVKASEPDDYDDDFEAYDDDFEEDEDSKPTPKGSSSSSSAASNAANSSSVPKLSMAASSRADAEMKILRQSVEQENSQAMERRQNMRKEDEDKKLSAPSPTPQYNNRDRDRDRDRDSKSQLNSPLNSSVNSSNSPLTTSNIQQSQQQSQLKKKKTTGLMGFSNVSNMTQGPRMKRLQQLRASGVLEMQDEKSVILNIIPSSQYEVYHRQVFSQNPQIRQMGVPFDISRRDMEVATDEIVMNDKEMQFVYGDDTGLINAMNRVAFRKMAKKLNLTTGNKDTDTEMWNQPLKTNGSITIGIGAENDNLENKGKDDIINENRLNLFLQAAAQLCEDIMDEEGARSEHKSQIGKDRSTLPKSLFSSSDWISLGGDVSEGANELVRGRTVSAVSFSSLQPHLLLTSHPYNESDETDLRPFKGIYCVWSLSAPGAPSVVLEGSGQPTCCSFSATQTYVILGGTSEGTLHMWDLRETNALHANRDTIDLRIAKGLRKPCYSTQTLTVSNSVEYAAYASTLRSSEMSDVEWDQHACPIVQIEPVSSSTTISSYDISSTSQFISLDSSGKAIIWVASQTSGTTSILDHGVDYGLSPWGKMRLVRQRVLYGAATNPLDSLNFGRDLLPRSQPSLGVIPGDTSMFLLSYDSGGHGGTVKKVVRYDTKDNLNQSKNSKLLNNNFHLGDTLMRSNKSHVVINLDGRDDSKEDQPMGIFAPTSLSTFTSPASAISVSSHSISLSFDSKNNSPLVLVGRTDGSLDIFVLESGEILTTWNDLTLFQTKSRQNDDFSTDLFQTSAIVYVTWVPWKSIASFIAVDSGGYLYYFDLTRDSSKPLYVEDLSVPSLFPNLVHLSSCRSVGGTVHIAVGDYDTNVGNGSIKIKKLSDDLIWISSLTNNNNGSNNSESKNEGKDDNNYNDEKSTSKTSSSSSSSSLSSIPCLSPQQSSWVGRVTGSNVVMEYRGGSGISEGNSRK